jgi:hypothetical protein
MDISRISKRRCHNHRTAETVIYNPHHILRNMFKPSLVSLATGRFTLRQGTKNVHRAVTELLISTRSVHLSLSMRNTVWPLVVCLCGTVVPNENVGSLLDNGEYLAARVGEQWYVPSRKHSVV